MTVSEYPQRSKAEGTPELMLSPYRILDLTDEKGWYAGQVLGSLGADVIKIIGPGEDWGPAQSTMKTAYWMALNSNKRAVSLDIHREAGRSKLIQLIRDADVLIDSTKIGHLGSLGLGYPDLKALNPRIILASISPFGQTGPYAGYLASDLTCWAAGGLLAQSGDQEMPPVRTGYINLSYLLASLDAAWATVAALYWRRGSAQGQQIDVSIQASIAKTAYLALESWEVTGRERPRGSSRYSIPWSDNKLRIVWELKDGWAYKLFSTGEFGARENPLIVKWMADEGMADEYLLGLKWAELDWRRFSQAEIDRLESSFQRFFSSKTKAQIEEGAIKRGIVLQVIYAPSDILKHPQLQARQFWKELPAKEGVHRLMYPRRFCLPSKTACDVWKASSTETDQNPKWATSSANTIDYGLSGKKPPGVKANRNPTTGALSGVRVVAFEQALAMPLCTSLLAANGAEVIRVETSTRLDWHRQAGPFINNDSRPDLSVPYLFVNSGKLGVTINLKKTRGIELARRLAAKADVVVENYAPGVLGRLGLGYDDLSTIKPDIIMCSAGIFGQTGPYGKMRGHGGPLTALTGFPSITGHPGQMPQFPGFVLTDFTAPRACLLAIISALDYRARTGVGQYLDVSQFESAVHLLTSALLAYQMENRNPAPIGNQSSDAWPCGVYRCGGPERWCAIVVNSEAEWEKLCVTMDMAELAGDARFKSIELRQNNHEELDRIITAWTEKGSAQDIMRKLQAGGIEAMAVQTGQELGSDPQLKHRGFYRTLDQMDSLRYTYSGSPALMSANLTSINRAPQLGEHNAQVFTGLLGIDEEEFVKLLNEGVLE